MSLVDGFAEKILRIAMAGKQFDIDKTRPIQEARVENRDAFGLLLKPRSAPSFWEEEDVIVCPSISSTLPEAAPPLAASKR